MQISNRSSRKIIGILIVPVILLLLIAGCRTTQDNKSNAGDKSAIELDKGRTQEQTRVEDASVKEDFQGEVEVSGNESVDDIEKELNETEILEEEFSDIE